MRLCLALLPLLAAIAACDAPPQKNAATPPVASIEAPLPGPLKPGAGGLTLSEQCERAAGEIFRRDWREGTVTVAEGFLKAAFLSHYNARRNTCFYLLTVGQCVHPNGEPGALSRKLFDLHTGELYGELAGNTCRVDGYYCASGGEWEVLVEPYMEVSRDAVGVELSCLRSQP